MKEVLYSARIYNTSVCLLRKRTWNNSCTRTSSKDNAMQRVRHHKTCTVTYSIANAQLAGMQNSGYTSCAKVWQTFFVKIHTLCRNYSKSNV